MKIADENGVEKEIVKYLQSNPTLHDIEAVLKMLGISARELMRTKEAIYKELDLKNVTD